MQFQALIRYRNGIAAAVLAALIFLSSGRLDYWQGWLFLGLTLGSAALSLWLLKDRPGLIAERLHPGRGVKWWDKGYYLLATPLNFSVIVLAAVDAGRRHWSAPPQGVAYVLVVAVFLAGQGFYLWAKRANPFFSSVVRLQTDRGQTVCREGPYRICRHPGYLGGLLFGLATPVVLGSYWALIPQGLAALLLLARTCLEDRMLTKDLLWYPEYREAVPYRLVPGLW